MVRWGFKKTLKGDPPEIYIDCSALFKIDRMYTSTTLRLKIAGEVNKFMDGLLRELGAHMRDD
jgi:hypothetical protein